MINSKGLLYIKIQTRIKYRDLYPNLLYALFCAVYIVTHLIQISPVLMNALTALSGMACFAYTFLFGKKRIVINKATFYAILFSMLMTLSSLYNANTELDSVLWIWGYLGVALLLYIFQINYKLSFTIYYLFCIYIFFEALVNNTDANELLSNGSRNGLVTHLLFLALISYFCVWKKKRQLPYFPSLALLILSVWTTSRGGVVSSSLLLGLIFIYNFLYVKKGKISSLIKIFVVVLIICVVLGSFLSDAIEGFSDRLDKDGIETSRFDLWEEYFKATFKSAGNFFLGTKIDQSTPQILSFSKNPHNSFLMLHSRFGIMGFVLVISAILKCLITFLKKKNYVYLIILVVVISRAFTDWLAFNGAYDAIFWYMFFCLSDKDVTQEK